MTAPRLASVLLAALAATGCVRAERIREDLYTGRTRGAYIEGVPFERQKPGYCGPAALSSLLGYWGRPATQEEVGAKIYDPKLKGTLGFDLWRYARKPGGLVSLQAPGLEVQAIDCLLDQGVPVLLNLGLVGLQHYVLVVGHDRGRGLWVIQDGRVPDKVVSEGWLARRREPTKGWGLVAFPPERKVTGLGAELHRMAAERAEELRQPEPALAHLEAVLAERGQDPEAWFGTGRLLAILGRKDEAEKAYRQAIRLAPETPDAFNNLALLLAGDPKRVEEAEALARCAVTASRKDAAMAARLPYALDTLGLVFLKQRRALEAQAAFEAALKAVPPGMEEPAKSDLEKEIRGHMEAR